MIFTIIVFILIFGIAFYYDYSINKISVTEEDKIKLNELYIRIIAVNKNVKQFFSNNEAKRLKQLKIIFDSINKDTNLVYFTMGYKKDNTLNSIVSVDDIMNPYNVYIILTNSFFIVTNLNGNNVTKIPFEKIERINKNKKSLKINEIEYEIKDVNELSNKIEEQIENNKSISIHINKEMKKDVADKIAKLKSLYDDGVLTEYEFNMKKKELLDKE